jgi:hypothetical protein
VTGADVVDPAVKRACEARAPEPTLAEVTTPVAADIAAGIDGVAHAREDHARALDLHRHRPVIRHVGEGSDPVLGHP